MNSSKTIPDSATKSIYSEQQSFNHSPSFELQSPNIKPGQSPDKREEFTKQHSSSFGLLDRPKIKQPSPAEADAQQPRLRLIFEPDPLNNFLVTNPTAIFKFIRPDRFLKLSEQEQIMVIDRLEELMKKCAFNAHLISEQVVTLNVSRSNQESLDYLRRKLPKCIADDPEG
jgi:hypothetical protein